MINSKLVSYGCMVLMEVASVFGNGVTEVVGFTEGHASTKSAARHEDRVSIDVVVAATFVMECRVSGLCLISPA